MEVSASGSSRTQEKKTWRITETKSVKRARAGSSEEEDAPLTLKNIACRLGHALLQLRQGLGKSSPAFMKAHERELSEIYKELQLVEEEAAGVDTNTQGTQTDRPHREDDILEQDLTDDQLLERLPSRWSTWAMNRLTQVTNLTPGEDSCHYVNLTKTRPGSQFHGTKPGAMIIQDSTVLEDNCVTSRGTRYTVVYSTEEGEKAAAAQVIKAMRRVVSKPEEVVFVIPPGPEGIFIRKIVIYLSREKKSPPKMILPNLGDQTRARSRSASVRRAAPPVTESKTVVVRAPGKSYADLLKTVKDRVSREEAGEVLSIRKGRNQEMEVRIQGTKKAGEFTNMLRDRAADLQVDLRTRGDRRTVVHIKDLEYDTTENEIKEALDRVLGKEESYRITSLRGAYGETKNATVITTHRGATKLVASRLRVGWVHCRTYIRTQNERCHRCWATGHGSRNCKGPDRGSLCYNCGGAGHLIRECREATRCLDCKSSTHRTGSSDCCKTC